MQRFRAPHSVYGWEELKKMTTKVRGENAGELV